MTLWTAGKTLVAGLVSLTWLLVAGGGVATGYNRIVAFGDSLSDPGNAFVLLHEVTVQPFELIPDAPYARGARHFSDGPTWVEQLENALGLGPSAGPALEVPGVFSNYAVGGARARLGGPADLTAQVAGFLTDFGPAAPGNALYVVHIGGNDVRDALQALVADPTFATSLAILGDAVDRIAEAILALASAGAHTFLVPNAPDLSLVPAVRLAGPDAQAAGQVLAGVFNTVLEGALTGLETSLGVTILRLDSFTLLQQVVGAPADFGLSEVERPCITPFTSVSPFCAKPDTHLFWDGIHPTRAGHAIMAREALVLVNASQSRRVR